MINSNLGLPKQKFEDTFSAEDVVMETYFPKYRYVALIDPETKRPNGMLWKVSTKLYDKIMKFAEENHSPVV